MPRIDPAAPGPWRAALVVALVVALVLALVGITGCAGPGAPSPEAQRALDLERQGQYAEALPVREHILQLTEKTQGADSPALAQALADLAADQVYAAEVGQMFEHRDTSALFASARTNLETALRIDEKAYGPDDARAGELLRLIGIVARFQGHLDESERFYRRALALYQKAFGHSNARVADILWEIAELDERSLRFAEEEGVLKEELAMRVTLAGPQSLRVAQSLDHIGNLELNRLARFDLAEQYFERSLAIRDRLLPPDDPLLGESLLGLALAYQRQNRLSEALPLLQRAEVIREKHFGPESKEVAIGLNLLAGVYEGLGKEPEERAALVRMLAIFRKVFGENDPDVAIALMQIGDLDRREGNLAEARRELKLASDIEQRQGERGNPGAASLYLNLAKLALSERHYEAANDAGRHALAILEPMARTDVPEVILAHDLLAQALRGQGQIEAAFAESQTALDGLSDRAASHVEGRSSSTLSERRSQRLLFLHYVENATALAEKSPARRLEIEAQTFRVSQLAQASSTAEAVAGMAARFAARDDALAALIRQRQDAQVRWRLLDGLLVQASVLSPAQRDLSHEAAMRAELKRLDAELTALDARMASEFPKYAEIASPAPLALTGAQELLGPREAMLVYMVGEGETSFWALTRTRAQMFHAAIGRAALDAAVLSLRRALDPTQLSIASSADIPPFDLDAAWQLYDALVAPASGMLSGTEVVFVVPDGALQSLPLGVLVTAKPAGPIDDLPGYRDVPWLAKRFATTVLPSVSSLRALRSFAETSQASEPFLGIGDPALGGSAASARGVRLASLFRGADGDVATLRRLPDLPESADELRAIAHELGAGSDALVLRERARKPRVTQLDFARYRIVAFATHGLVAGDLTGLAEPALVLTPPPEQAQAGDDGLLTASDVSQLRFDADWVVLSACNTAAGDGSLDAEGLSGLARAFFYAGSRTLLVSHWPVFSNATVKLTTGTFESMAHDPSLPRAVALQHAMAALRDDRSEPYFAHPMFWAPFVVVGEGGGRVPPSSRSWLAHCPDQGDGRPGCPGVVAAR